MNIYRRIHRPDYFLLALVFLLTVSGLVILASASSDLGKIRFNDSYYYLKHQIYYGLCVGIVGFIVAFNINYQRYKKFVLIFLAANLLLLILVFTPLGVTQGGASRWLRAGPIVFQPAEFLKLTFFLYIAAWISNKKMDRTKGFLAGALPFFVICGFVGLLLLLQPATSTVAILLASGMIMYFVSGVKFRYLIGLGAVCVAAFAVIIWITPYRMQRITNFFHPEKDTQGSAYQINQALITIGSGSLWGVGYGQSTSKVNYLPAPLDDSIFAIAAQELGFIGAASLVIFFGMLVARLLYIAHRSKDKFAQLILIGFASTIALQSIVNMGAISGVLPLTGVPLPFISYGGTALATFLTMMGIAGNISRTT